MGHQAILYGRIQSDWEGTSTPWPVAPEYNRAVLNALPDSDDRWPFLTRHMFGVAERSVHDSMKRGNYRGQVVHFAASTKDDLAETKWPEQFLAKLEEFVLKRLLWSSVKVHFESAFWPERAFVYLVNKDSLSDVYTELSVSRFGERIDAEVGWVRQELPSSGCKPTWLY